jgi:signal transduction histidine kinase
MPYDAEEICLMDLGHMRIRIHVNPVRDENEVLLGSVTLLHDVAQLSAIEKVKSNFLAMVSHQLKSPLSSTLLQTSILLDGMVGELNEKQTDLIKKVKAKIRGMTDLVNDVLDVCFIEEGAHVAQIESLNLHEILNRTIELMQPQAQDKQIDFQITVEENLPLFTGNRSSIEAMFINLISNAIKYTPPKGAFSVELKKNDNEHIQIKVSDNGIGIAKEDISRVFNKFFRERSERTKNISGTGLGLSIVKGVVDAHQGSIDVASEVGKGSTFTVMLPIMRRSS